MDCSFIKNKNYAKDSNSVNIFNYCFQIQMDYKDYILVDYKVVDYILEDYYLKFKEMVFLLFLDLISYQV